MEAGATALLFGAGVLGGAVNAVAGGATLFTFPAMLAAGLPPVAANASNAVALTPGHLVAAVADRVALPTKQQLVGPVAAGLCGGTLGALALLATSDRLFAALVPVLVGAATLLFGLGPRLRDAVARARRGRARDAAWPRLAALVPTAAYGGYFGGGLGVMLLAVLAVTGREEMRAASALKNLLASAVSAATIAVFVAQGVVRWPETVAMLAGAVLGGVAGARLLATVPAAVVRGLVVVAGAAMTVVYAWRYWA